MVAGASPAARLAALEQQFLEIERITEGLRRYLDRVAEMVLIAADELGESRMTTRLTVVVNNAAHRPPADTSRARATQRAAHHPVRH